ncbi:MAG: hypothetical protein K6U80_04145 [Firmicutes bacterium]|nr:hypothetical protein [Bacillota bacterium]
MRNQHSYRKVQLNPEQCLEDSADSLLGPKVERSNLTWQTKQILVYA